MEKKDSRLSSRLTLPRLLLLRYFRDQVSRSSAELAYYLLFSLFPTLIFVNAVLSMLHLSTDMLASSLGIVLPPQAAEIITTYLSYIQGLDTGILLYSCLFLAVYALSRSVNSLMRSVARAYRVQRQSTFRILAGIIFTVVLLLSIIILLLFIMVSDNLLFELSRYIAIPEMLLRIWNLLRVLIAPIYMFLVLACFYFVVGYRHYSFLQALPGAGFAVVTWFLATTGFSYYISHISRYSVLYGSLAAIMVLMLWFYLTGVIFIMGGELNHILAHRNYEVKRSLHDERDE